MNIPSHIPIDNLYKFIAISGLTILGISFVFPIMKVDENALKTKKLLGEVKILKLETQNLSKESENLLEDLNMLLEIIKEQKGKTSQIGKENYYKIILKKMDLGDEQMKKTSLIGIKAQEILNKNEINCYLINRINRYKFLSYFGIGIGTIMICSGFWLWYTKLQVYQDKILKYKAEEKS